MLRAAEWNPGPRAFTAGNEANGGAGAQFEGVIERHEVRQGERLLGTAHTIAYTLPGPDRPVVFIFNGGPGVSSVWLHLGGVGPFRVAVPDDLEQGILPPYRLEESAGSLLAAADLVFVDPIRTGYGRVADDADPSLATGLEADVEHATDVVSSWVRRHSRLGDRVFLLGESYGTIRVSLLATRLLQSDAAVAVEGVALLGQALNVQETTQRPTNVVGFVAATPFLAVTAAHHGLGENAGRPVQEVADEAHRWAVEEYGPALLHGNELLPERAQEIAAALSRFTGIPAKTLLELHLRIDKESFRRSLLPGRMLGLMDARYTAATAPSSMPDAEVEPTGLHLDAAFTALAHELLVTRLGAPADEPYLLSDGTTHSRWDYLERSAVQAFGGSAMPSPFALFDYGAHLRLWMRVVPGARLFIGTGHYDALTTVGSARHLVSQHMLPRERVTMRDYEAGHMMYTDSGVAARLGADLRAFIAGDETACNN